MGAFEHQVKELICDQFGSVAEFARIANLKSSTLSTLLDSGSFTTSRNSTVQKIARVLEVDAGSLINGRLDFLADRYKGYVEVPLYGSISAGESLESMQTDERYPVNKELVERYPGAFLLRVSGTSMNRILPDGCYALVHPCTSVDHSGQPYAVTVGSSVATIKRVKVLGNGLELVPDSTDVTYHSLLFDFAEPDTQEVGIIGRVVWYCLPINWRFD